MLDGVSTLTARQSIISRGWLVKSDRTQVRHRKECVRVLSHYSVPPEHFTQHHYRLAARPSIPRLWSWKGAFTSPHVVFYLHHCGQSGSDGVIQVVAAATVHDLVALDPRALPDERRDKIHCLDHTLLVVVVVSSQDRSQRSQMEPFSVVLLACHLVVVPRVEMIDQQGRGDAQHQYHGVSKALSQTKAEEAPCASLFPLLLGVCHPAPSLLEILAYLQSADLQGMT